MEIIIKIFGTLWVKYLRYYWSALRHRFSIRIVPRPESYQQYIPRTLEEIPQTLRALWERFEYKPDGWDRLFDSIDTPASSWVRAFDFPPLRDDCDGFHSALYWATSHHFESRLFTTVVKNLREAHTMLVATHNEVYHLYDYWRYAGSAETLLDLINLAERTVYGGRRVLVWELSFWNGERWISRRF